MTPDVIVTRGATYGFLVRCTDCGAVAHREGEIDADQLARNHRDHHILEDRQTAHARLRDVS